MRWREFFSQTFQTFSYNFNKNFQISLDEKTIKMYWCISVQLLIYTVTKISEKQLKTFVKNTLIKPRKENNVYSSSVVSECFYSSISWMHVSRENLSISNKSKQVRLFTSLHNSSSQVLSTLRFSTHSLVSFIHVKPDLWTQ